MKRELRTILNRIKKEKFKYKTKEINETDHLFIKGDCEDVAKNIPDNSIDLLITDPPYNKNIDYGEDFNDNKDEKAYFSWLKNKLKDSERILKETGTLYVINYPELNARILPYLEDDLGLNFQRWLTWHYPTNIGHSKKNFTRSQRSILFFTKSEDYVFNKEEILQLYQNPNVSKVKKLMKKGSYGRGAYDFITSVDLVDMRVIDDLKEKEDIFDSEKIDLLKNVSKDRFTGDHPCQLPLDLIKRLILVSSNKRDVVFDPFGGTFSHSLISAQEGRHSLGSDINQEYIDLGIKRLKNSF